MNLNINKFNNTQQAFGAMENKPEKLSNEDQFKKDTKNLAILLNRTAQNYIPEYGKFAPFSTPEVKIPGTQNVVKYMIENDIENPNENRRFSIGVKKQYSDEIEKYYLFNGTKEELLEYLQDEDNAQLFYELASELSNSVDEKQGF